MNNDSEKVGLFQPPVVIARGVTRYACPPWTKWINSKGNTILILAHDGEVMGSTFCSLDDLAAAVQDALKLRGENGGAA